MCGVLSYINMLVVITKNSNRYWRGSEMSKFKSGETVYLKGFYHGTALNDEHYVCLDIMSQKALFTI